jgi:hypothetical protein
MMIMSQILFYVLIVKWLLYANITVMQLKACSPTQSDEPERRFENDVVQLK